jgi:hypothetical protein
MGLVNIRMYLREMWRSSVDWIHLTQVVDQWSGPCEHDNEPSDSIKGGEFID